MNEEIIDNNPARNVSHLKVDEDKFIPLTDNEIRKILDEIDKSYFAQFRDYVAINLMLDTGVRSSELFQIKIEHVDFKMKVIHLHGDTTKSRKHRILPLSNGVARLVMEIINENNANWLHVEYYIIN